jgi:radical SAM protein with 4Fe4S-binding SPASM domain
MPIDACSSVHIPPSTGTRRMGASLCLTNLRRRESWIFGGTSLAIWKALQAGRVPGEIATFLAAHYHVDLAKVALDVSSFLEALWQRQLVDIPERRDVSDEERAALVHELPHNQSGRMQDAAFKADVLFIAYLDLLIPCNLRCRHCYLDFSEKNILPFSTVTRYLDQLADHGCPQVKLTGGEIFLRRDLIDVIAYAEKKGFLIELLTNGVLIDERKADRLAEHCLDTVQISIYGTRPEIHEAITRKPGTFARSINAARLLIERKIPVRLAYFIQCDNFEDAFLFPDFARQLGASFEFDSKLIPNRNGDQELLRHGVTVQQQAELLRSGLLERKSTFICTAARSKARITAHGEVFPCQLINTVSLGNLNAHSFADLWAAERRQVLRQDILGYQPKRCGSCEHTSECEPCAALRGYNEPGHMDEPISTACLHTSAALLAKNQSGNIKCVDGSLFVALDRSRPKQGQLYQIMAMRLGVSGSKTEEVPLLPNALV